MSILLKIIKTLRVPGIVDLIGAHTYIRAWAGARSEAQLHNRIDMAPLKIFLIYKLQYILNQGSYRYRGPRWLRGK